MSDRTHEPLSDDHRPVPSKKNTRKWCGGKEGRDHQWAWIASDHNDFILTCSNCQKKLQRCFNHSWRSGPCACGHHPR